MGRGEKNAAKRVTAEKLHKKRTIKKHHCGGDSVVFGEEEGYLWGNCLIVVRRVVFWWSKGDVWCREVVFGAVGVLV